MEMINAYGQGMCERRNHFSMYWDGVGVVRFEKRVGECSRIIRVRFGKSLKDYSDECLLLSDIEKRITSLESYQYIIFLDVSESYMDLLYILNNYSVVTNCYEPIIAFENSIMIFPKLKYNDTCFIKYMLKNQTRKYRLLWASKMGGCEEYV